METDLLHYFKKSNTPQYSEFVKACEEHNGSITDDGACQIKKGKAKVLIRDWRDNSIDRPDHELKNIWARNDVFFLCYANNSSMQTYYDQNKESTDKIFKESYKHWTEELDNTSIFPDWYVNRKDWRVTISNYGRSIGARKKECDEMKELRIKGLVDEVLLGHRKIEDVMMGEL